MNKTITALSLSDSNVQHDLICPIPHDCPHCRHGIDPRVCSSFFLHQKGGLTAYIIFYKLFIIQYLIFYKIISKLIYDFHLQVERT